MKKTGNELYLAGENIWGLKNIESARIASFFGDEKILISKKITNKDKHDGVHKTICFVT